MCAAMRGVKKANASMVTSAMLGTSKQSQTTRAEFFGHIGREQNSFQGGQVGHTSRLRPTWPRLHLLLSIMGRNT